jgi:2-oxoglutarate dehydrogenase E2 component (dihydrolipoamide succinyltransferase)
MSDTRTPVVVPTIGESITSAYIAQWFKKVGEAISEGDPLLEVDSDKASLEVPSPVSGVVVELVAEEGDEVPIGSTIAYVDASASASVVSADTAASAAPAMSAKGPQSGPAPRPVAA